MAVPAAVLSILVSANTGGASRGLMRFNSQLGATEARSNKALAATKTFAKGAAVATGIGLGYAVKKAADFEQQMDSLGAVSDATGKQMEQFRKQAMKAGADTKFSALEAAEGQTELAKGGLKVRQIMRGGLRSALALAAAGEMELAEAAETTANAIKLFGLEGKDTMKVADALATAANRTTADVHDFALALKMGGSVAKLAGMSFNETVVVLEALAEAGIKGSDAGTSLKAFFLNIATPSAKAAKAMEELGLNIFDAQGNLKSLPGVAANLRQAFGDLTKEQFLNKAGTIAGSDAIRTLYSLYTAGPEKLRKLEAATSKSGTAAEVARRKQDNLKGALENLQGSVETIAIGIGMKLLPTLTTYARTVTKLLNDPKLTPGEKFSRFMEMVTNAVSKAIPVVAAAGVRIAGAMAEGLARGWSNMNPLLKLFTAAAVLRLIGGRGVLLRTGVAIGTTIGAGVSAGAAGAITGGAGAGGAAAAGGLIATMRAKVLPVAKRLGLAGVGIALADSVISEFGRRSAKKSSDMFAALKAQAGPKGPLGIDLFGGETKILGFKGPNILGDVMLKDSEKAARKLLPALQDLQKAQRGIGHERARQLRNEIAKLSDATPQARRALNNLVDGFERTGRRAKWLQQRFEEMRNNGARSVKELATRVSFNTNLIAEVMGKNTRRGREAMVENFTAAAKNVRQMMRQGTIATKRGTALIEQYMVQALRQMGFSKEDALALRKRGSGSKQTPMGGELRPNQRGSYIDEGKPSGDSVPSLLERGEYVLNRKAVKKVGRKALDAINFGMAPRFQTGGIVELLHPGNDPAHHDHLHVGMDSSAAVVALGRKLQKMGWLVGEHPAFGPVGGHTSGSLHYSGQAIDVNWPDAGQEAAKIRALLPMLNAMAKGAGISGLGGMLAPKLKQVLVDGPDSPLKSVVQGALNTAHAAAQKVVDNQAGVLEGAESALAAGVSGSNMQMGRQMMLKLWAASQWPALRELWTRESGWSETARNPSSGAYGIPQSLPASKMGAAAQGSGMDAARAQIAWGLRYIKDRYGSPSAALSFHDANNWYREGGLVGMQKGGEARSMGPRQVAAFAKRVWSHTKNLGGAGFEEKMPKINIGGPAARGGISQYNRGVRSIPLGEDLLKSFANPTWPMTDAKGNPLGGPPSQMHDYALRVLIHEMAHAAQPLSKMKRWELEGGAELFAKWAAPQVYKALNMPYSDYPAGYPGFASQVLKEKSADWIQHGQFMGRDKYKPGKAVPSPYEMDAGAPPPPPSFRGISTKPSSSSGMSKSFGKALKTFGRLSGKKFNPKKRSELLKSLQKKIKDVGLPPRLGDDIEKLSRNAEIFGDMASRASSLTVEPLDEASDPILGLAGGKNEQQWLEAQLDALFKLRNKLIRADELIVKRREQIVAMIERTQKALERVADDIRKAAKTKRRLENALEKIQNLSGANAPAKAKAIIAGLKGDIPDGVWKALWFAVNKPKPAREVGKELKGQIKEIGGRQDEREKNRNVLNRLKDSLVGKRNALTTLRGENLTALTDIQGIGSPMGRMGSLPELGVLGGQIFDVQMRLREINTPKPAITDTALDVATEESESAELLRQLLRESNLRTAVSERQFEVFKNMPPYGGQFETGGVVPGPIGAARTIVAHGGETVTPPGGGGDVHINFAPGTEWLRDFVKVTIDREGRRTSRGAGRGLPSRGGGI